MRNHHHLLRAIPIVSLLLTLPGCVTSQGKLSVDLGALKECRRLGGPRPIPLIENYRALSAAALAELNKANKGDARRTRCDDKVIEQYAKATSQ